MRAQKPLKLEHGYRKREDVRTLAGGRCCLVLGVISQDSSGNVEAGEKDQEEGEQQERSRVRDRG